MLWPLTRRRHVTDPQLAQRIDAVRTQNPESERWLGLVEAAFAESGSDGAWGDAVLTISEARPVRAPILHQSQIAVRRRALHRWLRERAEGRRNAALQAMRAAYDVRVEDGAGAGG